MEKIEMKMIKDYHDLYLKCWVLLIADVFEKIRNNSLIIALSAPHLSWDKMLKMMKVDLELITNPDMFIFFEKRTWDRTSYIYNRYS